MNQDALKQALNVIYTHQGSVHGEQVTVYMADVIAAPSVKNESLGKMLQAAFNYVDSCTTKSLIQTLTTNR